jgi:hypothetical protein
LIGVALLPDSTLARVLEKERAAKSVATADESSTAAFHCESRDQSGPAPALTDRHIRTPNRVLGRVLKSVNCGMLAGRDHNARPHGSCTDGAPAPYPLNSKENRLKLAMGKVYNAIPHGSCKDGAPAPYPLNGKEDRLELATGNFYKDNREPLAFADGVDMGSSYKREEAAVVKSSALLSGQEAYCDQQGCEDLLEERKYKEAAPHHESHWTKTCEGPFIEPEKGTMTNELFECHLGTVPLENEDGVVVMETDSDGTQKPLFCVSNEPNAKGLKRIRWSYDSCMDWATLSSHSVAVKAKLEDYAVGPGGGPFTTNNSEVPCISSYASMFLPKGPGVAGVSMY